MTTAATTEKRGEWSGLRLVRWLTVGLLIALALSATLETVSAKASPASYQNGFNAACRKNGGTTKRVGSRIVRCTLGDGSTITCDFNTDPPTCTSKPAALVAGSNVTADIVIEGVELVVTETTPVTEATRADSVRAGNTTIVMSTDEQP